jgi:hypothetical protein
MASDESTSTEQIQQPQCQYNGSITMVHESQSSVFLQLPREIRDMIYEYAIDYPDMSTIFAKAREINKTAYDTRPRGDTTAGLPYVVLPKPQYLPLATPGLLLLNRQISAEAVDVLRKKTWYLKEPIPDKDYVAGHAPDIIEFIGEETLQNIRHASLTLDFQNWPLGESWDWTIQMLLDTWYISTNLETLHVRVENCGNVQFRTFTAVTMGSRALSWASFLLRTIRN